MEIMMRWWLVMMVSACGATASETSDVVFGSDAIDCQDKSERLEFDVPWSAMVSVEFCAPDKDPTHCKTAEFTREPGVVLVTCQYAFSKNGYYNTRVKWVAPAR